MFSFLLFIFSCLLHEQKSYKKDRLKALQLKTSCSMMSHYFGWLSFA